MKQKTMSRIIKSISAVAAIFFPAAALAQSFGVSARGDGWSFSIGSRSGGGGGFGSYGLPSGTIFGIVENILYWLLGILGIVGIIGFVIAGILYLLSAGDETKMETAKKAMMYSISGVIVGLAGYVIIQAAFWALSGNSNF